jgi:hypothetical protein
VTKAGTVEQSAAEAGLREARTMEARRWQSPAVAAAAAEAAEEDGGAGGPSRRQPRRGLHRASPYGFGPRRLLPKLPLASRIFPATSGDLAASGDLSSPRPLSGGSANGCCPYFCGSGIEGRGRQFLVLPFC